jgi:1,4-dihydroxy-2-naphthoate octaprenyltransferase
MKSGMDIWWEAARPRTLTAAIAPILVGLGAAVAEGALRPLVIGAILLASVAIQVGTNFINDWGDFQRGADGGDRKGPRRAVSAGEVSPRTMLQAGLAAFAVAAFLGLFLVGVGGWPIVWIGVLSILSGIAYTAGPLPLAYIGLGDLFVFVFFGPVAVLGTEWLMIDRVTLVGGVGSVAVGALATAILVVNNIRDVAGDQAVGKKTLIVRRGVVWGRQFYLFLLAIAFACPPLLVAWGQASPAVLLSWLALPMVRSPLGLVRQQGAGRSLNGALAETARLQLVFSALFALGLLV